MIYKVIILPKQKTMMNLLSRLIKPFETNLFLSVLVPDK